MSPPARKTIDLEGRIVKDGVKKALRDRQLALTELVHAIREVSEIGRVKTTHVTGDFSFLGNAFSGFQGALRFVARIRRGKGLRKPYFTTHSKNVIVFRATDKNFQNLIGREPSQ